MSNKFDEVSAPGPESPQSAIDGVVSSDPTGEQSENRDRGTNGRFTVGNKARALTTPTNVARRTVLEEENVRDYKPQTSHARSMCRRKAHVDEMLERVRLGTPEHQRLEAISQDLASRLEAARSTAVDPHLDVDSMSLDEIAAEVDRLRQLRDQLAPLPVVSSSPIPARTPPPEPEPEAPSPDPEVRCTYCWRLASSCTAIQQDDLQWLSHHRERADVAAFLAKQKELRAQLGWDARTIRVDGAPREEY